MQEKWSDCLKRRRTNDNNSGSKCSIRTKCLICCCFFLNTMPFHAKQYALCCHIFIVLGVCSDRSSNGDGGGGGGVVLNVVRRGAVSYCDVVAARSSPRRWYAPRAFACCVSYCSSPTARSLVKCFDNQQSVAEREHARAMIIWRAKKNFEMQRNEITNELCF